MEAVLIIPAFVVFLVLVVGIGRIAMVRDELHGASVGGSRVASLASDSSQAKLQAERLVNEHLKSAKSLCRQLDIDIDASALDLPPGQPGAVRVTLDCTLTLGDLSIPGLPGQIHINETFTTDVDPYVLR
jgi:hypothetical protein